MSSDSRQRWLEISPRGAVTVVRLLWADLLPEEDVAAVGKRLLRVVEDLDCYNVVLDMARVERLDSAMIGKLIAVHKKAKALGGRVGLCALQPAVRGELESLHLHRLIPFYDTEEEAVAGLSAGP
jgi:anti-anti-sigma factor